MCLLVGQTVMPVIHDQTRVLCGACIKKHGMYEATGTKLTNFSAHNSRYHASQKLPHPQVPVANVDGWVADIGGEIEDDAPIAGAEVSDMAGEMVRMAGELAALKSKVQELRSGQKQIFQLVKKLGAGKFAPVEEVTTPANAAALAEESDSDSVPEPSKKKQRKKPPAKKQPPAPKAAAPAPASPAESLRKRRAPGRLGE
jgi:hypothetical protein